MKNKKTDIVFVEAQDYEGILEEPSLGLLSIATLLKKNKYNPVIVRIVKSNVERISRFLNDDVMAVGFGVMTIQVPSALEISKYIKKNYPKIKIIWGGIHPNLHPKQVLENENIDIVVFGDGEHTVLEIIERLKKNKSLKGVKGCGYKENEKIVFNEKREPTDISKLPEYDYSLIYDIEDYIKESSGKRYGYLHSFLPLQSSVGCPFNCSFCYNTRDRTRKSARKIKVMLDEIQELQRKYNVNHFKINDELFFANKERVKEFLEAKKKRKMKFCWEACFHVALLKNEYNYSDAFLSEIKKEGIVSTAVGVEAGSIAQLERYRKNITPEDVIKVAKRMERLKIITRYLFMIAPPHETHDDMIDTVKLIYDIKVFSPRYSVIVSPQIYKPYPGCDLYEEAIKLGFKPKEKLEDWSKINPTTGYTSYDDLPYVKDILPRIYSIMYYIKMVKFLFGYETLSKFGKNKKIRQFLTNKRTINITGSLIKKTVENGFIDFILKKIFNKSFILEK